ncbi:MAG: SET domain-containing protein-lysine N-methyltransferase [Micavibrio sp.]|nr:SET domain-containing protein-lysine N-methyltransferase [Micavibrio sp.]
MFRKKQRTVYRRNELFIDTVAGKGRGVFCYEDIKKGELIEVAPVMVFPEKDSATLYSTLFGDYCFSALMLPEGAAARAGILKPEDGACFVMGTAAFCNHLSQPNAEYELVNDWHTTFFILTAAKDIPKETEICITYGPTWFAYHRHKGKLVDPAAARRPPAG